MEILLTSSTYTVSDNATTIILQILRYMALKGITENVEIMHFVSTCEYVCSSLLT